jgi:uncharacterized membrane protein required for colicin V production
MVLLPLGAAVGFLTLEMIGIPLIPIILVLMVLVGRRAGILPEVLMSFGLGFAASVAYFATRTADRDQLWWYALPFALGVALLVVGYTMLLLRRARHAT